ncbi:hypothetical protein SG34_032430 [Thalassomonas viridans]|uniref:Uncharacterized protein n=1 Tax=Thalassomonas viridans TaxID=137584 RepID=A0AAE9Z8T1_9GAMM|nr:hypothetical protein [Thalassomonas viridans]WDE08628.1 hypothetical protein SG34_032430 [Thalassomonas viridans]
MNINKYKLNTVKNNSLVLSTMLGAMTVLASGSAFADKLKEPSLSLLKAREVNRIKQGSLAVSQDMLIRGKQFLVVQPLGGEPQKAIRFISPVESPNRNRIMKKLKQM